MTDLIKGTVSNMVSNFLYYDRKEDEDLPLGVIQEMIKNKNITVKEIVDEFEFQLNKGLSKL